MNRNALRVVVCAAAALSAAVAPAQFSVFNPANGSLYLLGAPANLAGARAQATTAGGYLASFSSTAEQNFVLAAFASVLPSGGGWIGLSDQVVEGQFLWDDGGPVTFTTWAPGEPNNLGDEDGVVLFAGPGGAPRWNDAPVAAVVPSIIEIASKPGDYCTAAVPAPVDGVAAYDSLGFALSGVDNLCDFPAGFNDQDFWFLYTAPSTGTLYVSNCPSSAVAPGGATSIESDTVLAVWSTNAAPPTTSLACEDGSVGCGFLQSELSVAVQAGQTYYVQVAPWDGYSRIAGQLRFRFVGPRSECVDALPIFPGANGPFSTVGETDGFVGLVGCEYTFRDVWFTYVPTSNSLVTLTTATPPGQTPGTLNDPNLIVYDACGGSILACADGNPGVPLTAKVVGAAGQPLYIRVAGYFGFTGSFFLTASEEYDVLRMDSRAGPGSLVIENVGATSNAGYLTVLTLAPGAFPNGWFFGVDPTQTELLLQIASFAPPFVGATNAAGASLYGPVFGLPPFALYGVTVFFDALGGFRAASAPITTQIL